MATQKDSKLPGIIYRPMTSERGFTPKVITDFSPGGDLSPALSDHGPGAEQEWCNNTVLKLTDLMLRVRVIHTVQAVGQSSGAARIQLQSTHRNGKCKKWKNTFLRRNLMFYIDYSPHMICETVVILT